MPNQFIRKLEKEVFVSLKALFIDGTKIEANANRYTFVWRGSINYHLVGLLDAIENGYNDYNTLITENAYDVQIAVENYFVVHSYVSADRTDYNPLIPVLQMRQKHLGRYPNEVTADSGYSSEKNLLFLQQEGIESFIKLQEHEMMKKRAYKGDIGKYRNMMRVDSGYLCANNRLITFDKTEVSYSKGYKHTHQVYSCKDCSNYEIKPKCLYKKEKLTKLLDLNLDAQL